MAAGGKAGALKGTSALAGKARRRGNRGMGYKQAGKGVGGGNRRSNEPVNQPPQRNEQSTKIPDPNANIKLQGRQGRKAGVSVRQARLLLANCTESTKL